MPSLMIADKSLLDRKWPADSDRRQRHLYDGYAVQEAGLKRRSTISHPRVEPHDRSMNLIDPLAGIGNGAFSGIVAHESCYIASAFTDHIGGFRLVSITFAVRTSFIAKLRREICGT